MLCATLPSPSVPSTVIFMLSPATSTITVSFFGVPGVNFDLAELSFQVPTFESAARATAAPTKHAASVSRVVLVLMSPPRITSKFVQSPAWLYTQHLPFRSREACNPQNTMVCHDCNERSLEVPRRRLENRQTHSHHRGIDALGMSQAM